MDVKKKILLINPIDGVTPEEMEDIWRLASDYVEEISGNILVSPLMEQGLGKYRDNDVYDARIQLIGIYAIMLSKCNGYVCTPHYKKDPISKYLVDIAKTYGIPGEIIQLKK